MNITKRLLQGVINLSKVVVAAVCIIGIVIGVIVALTYPIMAIADGGSDWWFTVYVVALLAIIYSLGDSPMM